MTKIIYSILLQFLFLLNANSQLEPCNYIPLEFNGINPIWVHTMKDTSIIGYIHEESNLNSEFAFYDGFNHLDFDKHLSFVKNEFAYLLVILESNQDEYGSLIEKIDLNTGDLVWQYSIDPRTDTTFHSVQHVSLMGENLIIEGLRPVIRPTFGFYAFGSGYYSSYYFRKIINDLNGELVDYSTPVSGDSLAHITGHFPYQDIYNYTGTEVEHLELQVYRDRGASLVRNFLDINGNMTDNSDTVVHSYYYDVYDQSERTIEAWRGKIRKENENSYFFVHEFIPNDTTSLPTSAELVNYDSEFNTISSVDLTQYVFEEFKAIGIHSIDEDKIVLRGCLQTPPICKEFYYVLDRDYNLLDYFVSELDGENVYGNVFISNNGENYVIDREYNEVGQSTVTLNITNENKSLDTVRIMNVVEPNWAASPDFYTQLDNGDWIIKWSHGCWGDGVFDSFFHELWRVSASDFELMVGILNQNNESNDLTISPNPASDIIRLNMDMTEEDRVLLYDNQGQLVEVYNNIKDSEIDVSSLISGLYHIRIDLEDGSYRTGRFVKR